MGLPIGGRPTNPMTDGRVPRPDSELRAPVPTRLEARVRSLLAERDNCTDERVVEIDHALITMLYPWCALSYHPDSGCGSMFRVQTRNMRAFLERERFYRR